MSFNVALSGLNGASKDLEATGNNIANASTVGFKKSRVEFGDIYSEGFLNNGSTAIGNGVRVQDVRQLHSQGGIAATDNGLDMAISGEGFFVLNNGGETRYSRAGQFGLSDDGFLQNNQGMRVQGYPAGPNGFISGISGDLRVETENLAPRATDQVTASFNLDSRVSTPETDLLDADGNINSNGYNYASTTNIYDSLGNPHTLSQYFVKDRDKENSWNLFVQVDDKKANVDEDGTWQPYSLDFDTLGKLSEGTPSAFTVSPGLDDGAEPLSFNLDLSGTTQFGSVSGRNSLDQNGYTTGRLTGLDVADDGSIFGRYSNGRSGVLGQVALANFGNPEGLTPVGETSWVESLESGAALVDKPGTGSLGSIKAGSLEESNVDLSQQLVDLIVAQRNFQANAKTIETSDAVTQTIINMR